MYDMERREEGLPHVLVVPFPTQGHLSPAICLAQLLGEAGLLVTIAHTPGNLQALRLQTHSCGEVEGLIAPVPVAENVLARALPLDPEQTRKLAPTAPFSHVFETVDTLSGALEHLIRDIGDVSYLISDSFLPWTMDVATKFGIPRAELWTSSATGYLIGAHIPDIAERGFLPVKPGSESTILDFIPGIPGDLQFRLADVAADVLVYGLSHPVGQFLRRAFMRAPEASRVLAHTFYSLEYSAVEALQAEHIRLTPIGPILPTMPSSSSLLTEDAHCLQWLDTQAPASVLFISFGSASSFSADEIQELALGIQGSQCPFLWALSPSAIGDSGGLPDGFGRLTADRGCIVSWVPQLAVLGHPAVGGFLSHCGWNSVLESLSMGVPLLGCPRIAEQNTNLWLITKVLMLGLAIPGLEKAGLKGEAVEEGIRSLMQAQDGAMARKRAIELRSHARNATTQGGSSSLAFQELVEEIKQQRVCKATSL